MLRQTILAASAVLLLGAAQAPAPAAKPAMPAPLPAGLPGVASNARTLLSVKEVMRHIVNPAAELYWKAGGEVDDAEGAKKRVPTPEDAARWAATLDAGYQLQEAGNLLMLQGRARDNDRWMKLSQQLVDAGVLAVSAAQAKDEKKVFDAGSALYNACFACHGAYIPRPANSLYKQRLPDDAFKEPK